MFIYFLLKVSSRYQLLIPSLPPTHVYQYENILSVPSPSAEALCTLLVSTIFCINYQFLFFLLNLPSSLLPAERGVIPSSSSPREQNVALGVKLFDYSVSYRLANLTLSHLAP